MPHEFRPIRIPTRTIRFAVAAVVLIIILHGSKVYHAVLVRERAFHYDASPTGTPGWKAARA